MSTRGKVQGRKSWTDWILVAFGALALNLAVFSAASFLQREVDGGNSLLARSVEVFMPEDLPAPPERKPEPPPKDAPPPTMKLQQLNTAAPLRDRPKLEAPALDLEMNSKLSIGLKLGAPRRDAYGLAEVDQGPMVMGRVLPMYPFHAKRQGVEGLVSVRFLVDAKGRVSKFSIIRAMPPNLFETAVRQSVLRWRFKPGYKDGAPVATWIETDIEFKLEK